MGFKTDHLIGKLEYHYPTNQTRKDACATLREMTDLLKEALPYVQQHNSITSKETMLQARILKVIE